MTASEKLARRTALTRQLEELDYELRRVFAQEPSTRNSASARHLLDVRSDLCDDLVEVGFYPWPVPLDVDEASA